MKVSVKEANVHMLRGLVELAEGNATQERRRRRECHREGHNTHTNHHQRQVWERRGVPGQGETSQSRQCNRPVDGLLKEWTAAERAADAGTGLCCQRRTSSECWEGNVVGIKYAITTAEYTYSGCMCKAEGKAREAKEGAQVITIGPPNTGLGAGSGQTQHKTRHRFVRPRENSQE